MYNRIKLLFCIGLQLPTLSVRLLITFLINWLIALSIKCKKKMWKFEIIISKIQRPEWCLQMSCYVHQQSKTHKYSVYNDTKQRKAASPHVREAASRACLVFLKEKLLKQITCYQNSWKPNWIIKQLLKFLYLYVPSKRHQLCSAGTVPGVSGDEAGSGPCSGSDYRWQGPR